MFSSNPFASSNVFSPSNPLFSQENENVYLNHHRTQNPFISGDFLFHAYNASPLVTGNVMQHQFFKGSGLQYCENHDDLLDSVISGYKKKLVNSKKDGHSKIYTARGPRDRRVRLSTGIAQKFFCLQDLLGFEKASKTLDWLFTKSKKAIKELVEETNHSLSSTVTDQSKLKLLEAMTGEADEDKGKKMKSVIKYGDVKKKKITPKPKDLFQDILARDQSRVMARARARERTREKMNYKNLDDDLKMFSRDDFAYRNP